MSFSCFSLLLVVLSGERRVTLCLQFQAVSPDPAEAEKLELMKMRTLERQAKKNELQRLRKAQVSVTNLRVHPSFIGRILQPGLVNMFMNIQL